MSTLSIMIIPLYLFIYFAILFDINKRIKYLSNFNKMSVKYSKWVSHSLMMISLMILILAVMFSNWSMFLLFSLGSVVSILGLLAILRIATLNEMKDV